MYPILLLILTVVDVALLVWAWRVWLRDRTNTALLTQAILLLLLWFDALTVAIGGWIGASPTLELMSRIRFSWFYLTMPLLLIGVVGLARQADFKWAQSKVWLIAACVLAVVFVALEVPRAIMADYHTACFADTLRYVNKVPVGQACVPGEEGLGGGSFSPAIPLIFLCVSTMGVLMWAARGWPWLGLSAVLFMAGTAVPSSLVGPFLTYPLDTLMTAAFVWTAMRFPGPPKPQKS
ncbi:MAG: hypothetical protein JNM81_15950 [Rhodospirillaceae bacterium]|nr:hypothetical protein [Rhodospirillaceae bacterium]